MVGIQNQPDHQRVAPPAWLGWGTFALAIIVGIGWLVVPKPDPSRVLRGHWIAAPVAGVQHEVLLNMPDGGFWYEHTPSGERAWMFHTRGKGYAFCAELPWDTRQCLPIVRHADTLTIGALRFAPLTTE